jgi:hypothetical protein
MQLNSIPAGSYTYASPNASQKGVTSPSSIAKNLLTVRMFEIYANTTYIGRSKINAGIKNTEEPKNAKTIKKRLSTSTASWQENSIEKDDTSTRTDNATSYLCCTNNACIASHMNKEKSQPTLLSKRCIEFSMNADEK